VHGEREFGRHSGAREPEADPFGDAHAAGDRKDAGEQ
jgi:hypothetical protein